MRYLLLVSMMSWTLTSTAQAQPHAADEAVRDNGGTPRLTRPSMRFDSEEDRHVNLWETRADYRSAVRLRTAGLVLGIIGGAAAVTLGIITGAVQGLCRMGSGISGELDACAYPALYSALAISAATGIAGALMGGIGYARVKRIRALFPVSAAPLPGGGGIARVSLRF